MKTFHNIVAHLSQLFEALSPSVQCEKERLYFTLKACSLIEKLIENKIKREHLDEKEAELFWTECIQAISHSVPQILIAAQDNTLVSLLHRLINQTWCCFKREVDL